MTGVDVEFALKPAESHRLLDTFSDPGREQGVDEEICAVITVQNILRVEGLKGFLDRGCRAETVFLTAGLRVQIGRAPMAQCLKHRSLSERKLFPQPFKVLRLSPDKLINDQIDLGNIQLGPVREFRIIPELVRRSLHIIW